MVRVCSTDLAQIMKHKHTKILWTWGPLTAYEVDLEGIDSSGNGAADVMEIIGRQRASRPTQQLILDNMMQGFLFSLFKQKWERYGRPIHIVWCAFDAVIVGLVAYLGWALKSEQGQREKHVALFYLLGVLLAALVVVELLVAYLHMQNMKGAVNSWDKLTRTVRWMGSFQIDVKFLGYGLLALASGLFLFGDVELHATPYNDPMADVEFDRQEALRASISSDTGTVAEGSGGDIRTSLGDAASSLAGSARRALKRGGGGSSSALGSNALLNAAEFGYDPRDQMAIEAAILVEGSGAASISGVLPLVWLLMGCGFAIQALALIDKATMPVPGSSTLLLSVKSTLRGELLTFMTLFLIYLIIYWWTLFLVYPRHESTPIVPQAIEFGAWWSSLEAMVLLSFVGQPLDLEYNPEAWARLGTWQGISMGGEHPGGTRSLLRPDTCIISFRPLCLLMCCFFLTTLTVTTFMLHLTLHIQRFPRSTSSTCSSPSYCCSICSSRCCRRRLLRRSRSPSCKAASPLRGAFCVWSSLPTSSASKRVRVP